MTTKVVGTVTSVSFKEGNKYGIQVNGTWFNGFGKCPVHKNEEVEVEFDESDKWNKIIGVKSIVSADFVPASELKERPNDKAITMEESYVKDILVALIENITKVDTYVAGDVLDGLLERAINSFKRIRAEVRKLYEETE